jgi:hypothetical protein
MAYGDFVACTVMFHNRRMVHGKVRGLLVEVHDRIATSSHHFSN